MGFLICRNYYYCVLYEDTDLAQMNFIETCEDLGIIILSIEKDTFLVRCSASLIYGVDMYCSYIKKVRDPFAWNSPLEVDTDAYVERLLDNY